MKLDSCLQKCNLLYVIVNKAHEDVHCELLMYVREASEEDLVKGLPAHQWRVEFEVLEEVFACVVEGKSFVMKKKTRVELGEDHSSLKRKANVAFFFFITYYAICIRYITQNIFTILFIFLLPLIVTINFILFFTGECHKTSGFWLLQNYICQEPTAVVDSSKSK